MEEEIINQNQDENKQKNTFLRLITNRKFIISFSAIIVFFVLEFTTHFVEIVIGNVLELTNPFRPKAGTVWEQSKKDQIANDQLKEITQNIDDDKIELADINDLIELKNKLEIQKTVIINSEQFKKFYNQIPPRFSYDIISPFNLLKLLHNKKWTWTKIVKGETSLSFYFLDGDKQILMDTYPPLTVLYNIPNSEKNHNVSLDSMEVFEGRTFSAQRFFTAFDDLSNTVKLQLINNPFLLIKWDNNIRQVAIGRYTNEQVVLIGFEINQGIYTEVYTFEASELAANYLIAHLNELYPELNLHFPERKYREYYYYQ